MNIAKLAKKFGLKVVTKTIPWRKCQDVPRFLKRLDKFEKRSNNPKIQVKKELGEPK